MLAVVPREQHHPHNRDQFARPTTARTKALVEVPRAHVGGTFHVTVAEGIRLPVACPEGARPGDVLEIDLPEGLRLNDNFLARLAAAEERELHAIKLAEEQKLLLCNPVYGWRFGRKFKSQVFDPYETEQQLQQRKMTLAYEQAHVRAHERIQKKQILEDVMAPIQQWRDGLNAAPALCPVRPSAVQRDAMESIYANQQQLQQQQQQQQRQQQQQQQTTGQLPPDRADALRESKASRGRISVGRAQHEAVAIAMQRQLMRDPRGAAFHSVK
jgi:hypothetical protein